jgi:heme/copper-type cytochrome/quinol oxidase subunit 2
MSVAVIAFALCAAACLIGHVAILHSVVRKGTARADAGVPRPKFAVELLWAVIPMLALAIVLTATWVRVRDRATPQPAEIMKVAR